MFASAESRSNFDCLVEYLKSSAVTAIVGAGLSVPMKPTWKVLYEEMQHEAGTTPLRSFDGDLAPLDLADFRDAMGSERYLAVLRRRFGGVVSAYPDLYARLDETKGFHQIATTNYDEFLAAVAVSHSKTPDLAIYPELGNTDARYVYLHGRADTADSPTDLVVCEDDYARAYGTPGQSRQMLRALLNNTAVFIGSSLEDLDLRVVLRERARLTIVASAPATGTLFAVLPAPRTTPDQPDHLAALEIDTRRFQRFDVHPIYYPRDENHTQLRSLLLELRRLAGQRPREALFLERAAQLDQLAPVESPTSEQVDEVVKLLRAVPELSHHFFSREDLATGWYEALRDSIIIPSATPPWDVRGGARQIALWPAASFMRGLAYDRPEAITELVDQLQETENWHVRAVLGRAVAGLPTAELRKALPTLGKWLNDPQFSDSYIATRLAERLSSFTEVGDLDGAFDLLGVLLAPAPPRPSASNALILDEYWLSELTDALSQLVSAAPDATYEFLKSRLGKAISSSDHSEPSSSRWRKAIEDSPQELTLTDQSLHFLLDQTRNALNSLLQRDVNAGSVEVKRLLGSESPLFRRLGLSAASQHPEVIPHLSTPILSSEYFDNEYFHELAVLVHDQFAVLDDESKALIHSYIREFESQSPGEPDDEYQSRALWFRWRWLHLVPVDSHTQEELEWWDEGLKRFGQHPEPFFLSWSNSSPSLVDSGELPEARQDPLRIAWEGGGAAALAAAFRETQGWGSGIASLVQDDSPKLLEFAPLLGPDDGERVASYLSAYEDLFERKPEQSVSLDSLIDLIERIANNAQDVPQTVTAAARFMRTVILRKSNALTQELLNRSMSAMAKAVTELSQPLDGDPRHSESMDQLNNPAGAAADAFMLALWRWHELSTGAPQIPDAAAPWIATAMDEGWGGIQMRHAIGQFWLGLEQAEPGWLERNADQLWPEPDEPTGLNARRAFAFGFFLEPRTSPAAILSMKLMLDDLVQDLAATEPTYLNERDIKRAVAERLATGWLWELEGFGFEGILGDFTTGASERARADFVWHLGRMHRMKADGTGIDTELTRAKQEEYWLRRVRDLGAILPVAEQSEELSTFCTWPFYLGQTLQELEERLGVSIDHLAHGAYTHNLLNFIASRAEAEPVPALNLLFRLIDRLQLEQAVGYWNHSRELESAMGALCRAGLTGQREQVLQLADRLERGGLSEYARQLEECSTFQPEGIQPESTQADGVRVQAQEDLVKINC